MAKKSRFAGIEDPAGDKWQDEANAAWAAAEAQAEKARAKAPGPKEAAEISAMQFYDPVPMPAFEATEFVYGDVLGRFAIQDGLVHDVTKAERSCHLGALARGASRQYVHFAHELEGNAGDAEPHDVCMS